MQSDILAAMLLDPFLTFDEVVKEFGAMSSARRPQPAPLKPAAVSTAPRVRRPARLGVPSVPVLHHLPATAG